VPDETPGLALIRALLPHVPLVPAATLEPVVLPGQGGTREPDETQQRAAPQFQAVLLLVQNEPLREPREPVQSLAVQPQR
jgi:hypothetical protein